MRKVYKSFEEAKKLAFKRKVELNKARTKEEKKYISFFIGYDIGARPTVYELDKRWGHTYNCGSFEYEE